VAKGKSITKNASSLPTEQPIGQPLSYLTANSYVNSCRKTELKSPNIWSTCDLMMEDSAVRQCVDMNSHPVIESISNGKFVGKKSKKSKKVADALNYAVRNLDTGTWREFAENLATDQAYGFSLFNIVSKIVSEGEYKGIAAFAKLSPRSPHSLKGWIYDRNKVEVIGSILKPMQVQGSNYIGMITPSSISTYTHYEQEYPIMWKKQMLLSTFNKTFNNPEGNPSIIAAYSAWKEKKLVEQYEIVGVSKDFGGVAILRVDPELLWRANQTGAEFEADRLQLKSLQENAAKMHSGQSTMLLLSSDLIPGSTSQYLNDFKLQGIDGNGKQYKSSEIIVQKNKDIYNAFGCGFLILGQDGTGSYALSSTQESVQDRYIERSIQAKKDIIDNQLVKVFIEMNKNNPMFKLAWNEMPEFEPAEYKKLDLDTYSKIIQRTKSVQGLPEEHHKQLSVKAGLVDEWEEKLDYKDKGQSRSGEGLGSSGTGNSQAGGISSTTNANNKSFYLEDQYKGQLVISDEAGNRFFVDETRD
jgi:hypothetical protein